MAEHLNICQLCMLFVVLLNPVSAHIRAYNHSCAVETRRVPNAIVHYLNSQIIVSTWEWIATLLLPPAFVGAHPACQVERINSTLEKYSETIFWPPQEMARYSGTKPNNRRRSIKLQRLTVLGRHYRIVHECGYGSRFEWSNGNRPATGRTIRAILVSMTIQMLHIYRRKI